MDHPPKMVGFLRWTVGRWVDVDDMPGVTFWQIFEPLGNLWLARHSGDLPAETAAIRSLRKAENRFGVRVDLQASLPDDVVIHEWSPRSQVGVRPIRPDRLH